MKLQVANLGKVAITIEENPWSINKAYDRNTIVENNFTSYISRIPVPKGQPLVNNRKYWVPFSTRNGSLSVSSFTIISSESQLPRNEEDNDGPYLIGSIGYFWVGTGGNAVDGLYQSINIQGPAGEPGAQGEPGTDGKDGITPHIGSDGYWWIGTTRTDTEARGPEGQPGAPGTNGKDGKNGKDGLPGANGANGEDGQDGYTPYIGSNDNWWINGKDTGKPSRGKQGPQGPAGTGGGSSNIYVDEDNRRVVLVLGQKVNTKVLYSPTNASVKLTIGKQYYDFLVNGNDLEDNITITATGGFKIKRLEDTNSSTSINLPNDEVNEGSGVTIRVLPPNTSPNVYTGVVTVESDNEEFETVYINVQWGDTFPITPDHGSFTPGSNTNPIGSDTEITN